MRAPVVAVYRDVVRSAVLLGGFGLAAIGVSGVLAEGFGRAFGQDFVAGDLPGVTYTAERCEEYFEYAPGATTCADAATVHHFGEVVEYRVAAGVLGLVALGVWWLVLRRRSAGVLPEAFEPTVATALFGVAALGLLAESASIAAAADSSNGVGDPLSAGIVAAVAAVMSAVILGRALLARAKRISRQAEPAPAQA